MILTQILPFADPTVVRLYGQFERGVYTLADGLAGMTVFHLLRHGERAWQAGCWPGACRGSA